MVGKRQHEVSQATQAKLEAYGLAKPQENKYEAFIKSANILSQLSRYAPQG